MACTRFEGGFVYVLACWGLGLAFFSVSGEVYAEQKRTLVWTNSVLAPWLYQDEQGRYAGLLYDVVATVAERLDLDLVIKEVPMRRTYTDLVERRADMSVIPGDPSHSPVQYLSEVYVSPSPLFTTNIVLLGLRGVSFSGNFAEYHIGGANLPREVKESFVGKEAVWTAMVSSDALVKALVTRRIEFAFDTRTSVMYSARKLGVEALVNTAYVFDRKGVFHLAWSKADGVAELAAEVEEVVEDMKVSGELARLIEKYADVDDYRF